MALARAGHDRAFEAIVDRYRRPLLRACRRILPEARAEDALQQALMAAWTALRRGDEVHDLRPWLYKIVRNTALNQLRVAGWDLDELVDTLVGSGDPGEEVERRALVRQTLMAVAALPERQRDALLRTAIEGRGQDEVARDLGLTDTALRQLVHRARVSVRAAATAVVPLPLAVWLAAAAPRAEPMAGRIAELVAGSSATGATLAKAGTVVVLAGGAVSAPALVDEHPRPARERPAPRAHVEQAPAAAVAAQARARPEPTAEPPRAFEPAADETGHERGNRVATRHEPSDRDRGEEHRDRGDDDRDRDVVRGDRDDDERDEDRHDASGGPDDFSADDDAARRDEENAGERRSFEPEESPEGDEEEPSEHDEHESDDDR